MLTDLTFCGPCIVIYLRNKDQLYALFFLLIYFNNYPPYFDVFPTVHHSIGYFFRTNFNAHFNMNMYVTLSSTCFGP